MRRWIFTSFLLLTSATVVGQTAPTLLPANGGKTVCPDTLLSLTFKDPPTLGTAGKIRIFDAADDRLVDTLDIALPVNSQSYTIQGVAFHAHPILISGNTATIHPHNNLLDYGKTYYVQIDPGTLAAGGTPFAGYAAKTDWLFSTKPTPPAAGTDKLVIAADGTGDFSTLQGALDFVPPKNAKRITLLMKKGTYTEIISMTDKSNLTILGEDREATLLTYANNERLQMGANSSSKRGVINALRSTGIAIANLSIRNATPKGSGGWQAETVIFKNNSQVILTDLSLYSFQDTLQMSSAGYVANCYIEGDVDFMWGTGPCFFQDCDLKNLTNGASFVVSRNTAQGHGFIYNNCKFAVKEGVTGNWLAQNQGYMNSEVVLLNCDLAASINPLAWRVQGQVGPGHYWEYNNITDGKPINATARLPGSKQLTKEADAETIANYAKPAFILAGWEPRLAPLITRQPDPVTVPAGAGVTFNAAAIAVPAPSYQWSKDGTPIPGATDPTLKIPSAKNSDAGTYTVTVKNPAGSATSSKTLLTLNLR